MSGAKPSVNRLTDASVGNLQIAASCKLCKIAPSIDSGRIDSLHVEPIRLGGRTSRKRVLSLDAKPPAEKFASPVPECVDIDRLRRALKLDQDEDLYFVANRIDLVPRRRLPEYLGWDSARVDSVRKRVQRRIERLRSSKLTASDFVCRGSSRHLWFREEIGGRAVQYALAELAPSFVKILAEEHASFFQPTSAAANLNRLNRAPMAKTIAA